MRNLTRGCRVSSVAMYIPLEFGVGLIVNHLTSDQVVTSVSTYNAEFLSPLYVPFNAYSCCPFHFRMRIFLSNVHCDVERSLRLRLRYLPDARLPVCLKSEASVVTRIHSSAVSESNAYSGQDPSEARSRHSPSVNRSTVAPFEYTCIYTVSVVSADVSVPCSAL